MPRVRPSVLLDIQAPYSALESLIYDRFLAPALAPVQAALFDRVLPTLAPGGSVLDVGCGGGQLVLALSKARPDAVLHGADLSDDQIRRARRRFPDAAAPQFTAASALALPHADGRFDVVLSVASLKHWPDRRAGLVQCLRVLRPGGRLFVVEVDRGCRLSDARRFVTRMRTPGVPQAVRLALFRTWVAGQGVDPMEAATLIEGLGLIHAEVEGLPGLPFIAVSGTKAAV